jgi:hypothetical protein
VAYVTEKRGVFYAVIYEGRNPVSGRERRRWHRCDDHAAAEQARERAHRATRPPAQHRLVADRRRVPPRPMAARQGGDPRTVDACPHVTSHRALPAPPPRRHPAAAAPDRALRDALPAPAHHRQPARRAARGEDRSRTSTRSSGPLNDAVDGACWRRTRRRATRAGPPQATIEPAARPLVDRRRARRLPRRHRREPPFDAVPPGRGDRDAARRGPRPALGRRPLRHRPHRDHPGPHLDRLPPRVLPAQDPHQPPQHHRRRRHHGPARRLATSPTRRARRRRRRQRARARVHPPDGQPLHPTASRRRSTAHSGASTCHRSGSTTCATPTPACCCATGCRSRSSPNASGTPTRRSR